MKSIQTLVVVVVLLLASKSQAQLQKIEKPDVRTVGVLKSTGALIATLTYTLSENDTTYSITYVSQRPSVLPQYRVVSFKNENNTVEELYKLLIGILKDEQKEKGYYETIKLGNTQLRLTKSRLIGIWYIEIAEGVNYFTVNENQINKLFGKNE